MTISGSAIGVAPIALMGRREDGQPTNLEDAAQKFEALLINQLLSSASDSSSGGWLGTGEADQAGLQAMQMAQQQFADVLASQGGLGLSHIVVNDLNQQASHENPGASNRPPTAGKIGKLNGGN